MVKQPKPKKCKDCREIFQPFKPLQPRCLNCAIEKGKKDAQRQREKQLEAQRKTERKKQRKAKEKLKTRSEWLKEAQTACNAYIRERDKDEPCISCGTTKPDIQYCAGHYKTRGAHPELRFHPFNIHKQCNHYCNNHLSGNIQQYRPNLIEKIGIASVEWLEGNQEAQNWTIEEIKEIKAFYKEQLKLLKERE